MESPILMELSYKIKITIKLLLPDLAISYPYAFRKTIII